MSEQTLQVVLPYLSGPGAAVLALLLVLVGLYFLIVKHLVPLVAALGKRHLDQIDQLISNQKAESIAITKTLASIDRRLARLEDMSEKLSVNSTAPSPDRLT